jgi:hypothetical protein
MTVLHSSRLDRVPVRSPLAICAGIAALAGCALWSGRAAADNTLGVDLSYNNAVNDPVSNPGAGVDVYFGPRLNLAILTLTTEVNGGFHEFGGRTDPTVYRGMVGGRLGIGAIFRPSIFAHIGAGHLRYDDLYGPGRDSRTSVAGDVGAALDFTVLPLIDIGVQVSYNTIAASAGQPAFDWTQAGAHIVFVFGGDHS